MAEDVEITQDGEIEITEGEPTNLTVSIGMKVSTKPYENMDLFSSMTIALKDGADLSKAHEQLFNYQLKNFLLPKYRMVRDKFKG